MENPCVEQFISSLAQSLKPGYPEFISRLNFSECREEINSLLSDKCDAHTASKGPLFRCLLLNFHRQTSLALQSKAALEKEVESLKALNASLLQEVQMANKKAMHYLKDLHAAELDLCSHKEELLRLRSEHLVSPQLLSQCDSGYSDSHSSLNSSLTLSQTDIEETCSLSDRRYSAPCPYQPLIRDTPIHAHHSKGGTRTLQDCSASSLQYRESDVSYSAHDFQPEKTVASDARIHSNAGLVLPSLKQTSQCPRLEELDFLARDIEHFDPGNSDQNIENYFRELERTLIDLPHATQKEKVRLVWKTSSKAVHKFIQSQPPSVRDDYNELCQALIEEFSSTADEITSMVAALQIKHSRREHPREYFKRLKHVYFQGKNAPGLEENPTFKSLFLRNLHPCVRAHVALRMHEGNPSMSEIRKMTQIVWETVVTSKTTVPASVNTEAAHRHITSKDHPHDRSKGGDKRPHRDTERNRHVHQLRRDRHSHRSCRRPYSEILAQNYDQPMDYSDDDCSISDHSSEHGHNPDSDSASECLSTSGYVERYSPEPQVKRAHKSSRVGHHHSLQHSPPLY